MSSLTSHVTDVVIIGSGPVGLFAIFECGMMRMQCHVVDALDMVGGQCMALYPEKPIYDIPAFPSISGEDLITNLKKQAEPFNPTYHLGQRVERVVKDAEADVWVVETSKGTRITAKVIIIAAGVGAFGPNKPPLDHLSDYENKSVFYYIKRREDFRGKKIVIAGGGDSAVDWAISLSELAQKVMLVHRRPKFRAAPESLRRLEELSKQGKVEFVIPYQLDSLKGSNGHLNAVVVKDLDGNTKELQADVLLPFFGLSMELGPILSWGLGIDHHHITVDPSTSETSLKGIYAIGDIATYPNKLKLILSGFAEAAQAAHQARDRVYPGHVWHFEYSTTQGVPHQEKEENKTNSKH